MGWPPLALSLHLCLLGDANSVHVQRWAGEMMARGCQVSLITARPQAQTGVEQRVLAPVRRTTDWLWRVGETRAHLMALKPDIVHAHYVTSYGYLAARCRLGPLFITAWGSDLLVSPQHNPMVRTLTGWILRQADVITGDSQDLLEAAQAYSPKAALHLVHWGVDLQRFRPVPWTDKPQDGFHIASLRAWEPNYNIGCIIDAVAALRLSCPSANAQLHLMGGGSLTPVLKAQVADLRLTSCVHFHGRLNDAQMQAVLSRCHTSVSVPCSDATSVSVLESMACGLSVIATNLPANRYWLTLAHEPEAASCLIDTQGWPQPQRLAQALQALFEQPHLTQRWGCCHRARIEQEGDRQVQMDVMLNLYEQSISAKRLGSHHSTTQSMHE